MPWLWGDHRYGYFLIRIDNNFLKLVDYHIPESVFPKKITNYKVENGYVIIIADEEKMVLSLKGL